MKEKLKKLKENDYVITYSLHRAARNISAGMMVLNVLFYFFLTPASVSGTSQFGPSPKFMPDLLTIAMFICSLVVFIQESMEISKKKAKDVEAAKTAQTVETAENPEQAEGNYFDEIAKEKENDMSTLDLHGLLYILCSVGAAVFYFFCAEYLGYMLTIAIIIVALMLLFGVRKPLTIIICTLLMSPGLYFAFTKLLHLVLPAGKLF